MENVLLNGDCLELMQKIPDGSVDMVLCDLPYGTTRAKWDTVIDLETLWQQYLRIGKDSAVYALFSAQPFTTTLIASQIRLWKHEWVWLKTRGSNFANTVREPFKEHEAIQIFSRGKWTYNKQMQPRMRAGKEYVGRGMRRASPQRNSTLFNKFAVNNELIPVTPLRVPSSFQHFDFDKVRFHPTQKPLSLCEYLIKTYSNEGELVLDNCMGSGSTCLAAKNLNRRYIGIEKDEGYFEVARKRLAGL